MKKDTKNGMREDETGDMKNGMNEDTNGGMKTGKFQSGTEKIRANIANTGNIMKTMKIEKFDGDICHLMTS